VLAGLVTLMAMLATFAATFAAAGCDAGSPRGIDATPLPRGESAPALTGLGATASVWRAGHAPGYATLITDGRQRVTGYLATISPRRLADAEALVRNDLPPDATASAPRLVVGDEATKCEIVVFTSRTLARVLGDGGTVVTLFQTDAATSMDTTRISHVTVTYGDQTNPYRC
jgi:hypothetical protein